MAALPVIGAAMPSTWLETHRDWLLEHQRDLEIQDFKEPDVLDDDHLSTRIKDINSKLEGYSGRMGIHAPFWNLTVAAYDSKIRAVVQDRFKQALDIVAEIGATHMVIHSPLAFLGAPGHLVNPKIENRTLFDLVHETLSPIVQQAEQLRCMLVIENIHDKSPIMLTNLVQSFQSDYVRQSLDVGHAYINHYQGAPAPDSYVDVAGELLGHVHLQDTDGYTDRHWAIGEGKVQWEALFRALSKKETSPRLILELRDYNAIPASANWLKSRGLAI